MGLCQQAYSVLSLTAVGLGEALEEEVRGCVQLQGEVALLIFDNTLEEEGDGDVVGPGGPATYELDLGRVESLFDEGQSLLAHALVYLFREFITCILAAGGTDDGDAGAGH